ncbi:Uncharacterised protein [Vibrio cholerae]|nr:Uncharacterised protein [Vibrio cholerae]
MPTISIMSLANATQANYNSGDTNITHNNINPLGWLIIRRAAKQCLPLFNCS